MSKIGKKPIQIPDGVTVEILGSEIKAKGLKGENSLKIHPNIKVKKIENQIFVERVSDSENDKALHGLYRNLINNIIEGVSKGFKKQLEIHGLGMRASLEEKEGKQKLILSLGFSHPVEVEAPKGISFSVTRNVITVEGIDKQLVGETAAKIRSLKKPEPYKGKGIRYVGEIVRRKSGKASVKTGGA